MRVGREALTAQQIPYIISGGIGGLFLLGLGAMLWLSADLRDEWRKLDAIERQLRVESDTHSEPSHAEPDPFEPKVARNGSSPGEGRRAGSHRAAVSSTPGPWPPRASVAPLGANAAGRGAARRCSGLAPPTLPVLRDQIGWLNLAVVGGVVGAATDASWLLAGRRAIGQRRRRLLPDVVDPVRPAGAALPIALAWCWVPGTHRAHRDGCQLAAGKPTVEVDGARIQAECLVRCELCGGDGP